MAATPHSADIERSVSANNLLKTALRNKLDITTENKYLFVHFNMPPLSKWSPDKAVINWINKKDRRTHNLIIENEDNKSKNQEYFKGIFEEANDKRTDASDYESNYIPFENID